MTIAVDVIVAVRNEEDAIPRFLSSLAQLPLPSDVRLRTVFVEDSSTDGTQVLLRRLAAADLDVGYHFLAEGFGQSLAIIFGMQASNADAIIMMDVDGSHPPSAIPAMIEAFRAGASVVQCKRRSLANRAPYRDLGAALFFTFGSWLTGVNLDDQKIYYRLVSANVAYRILAEPRYWHYLRFPLSVAAPAPVRLLEVDASEREIGQSKYGPYRLARLAVDAVLSLMPIRRLSVTLTALAVIGFTLAGDGHVVAGVALLAGTSWLAIRHRQLGRADVLRRMVAVESANVDRSLAKR